MAKSSKHDIYEFDEFRLDAAKLMFYRASREISLPPKVVETLLVLVEKRGEIVSKDELMNEVWTDSIVEESNLSQCLYRLRKILGNRADGEPYIETLRRRGYRFNAAVRLLEASPLKNDSAAQVSVDIYDDIRQRTDILTPADWRNSETSTTDKTFSDDPVRASAPFKRLPIGRVVVIIAAIIGVFLLASFFYVRHKFAPLSESIAANTKGELTVLRLTNGNVPQDATISPDGKYFTYHEQDGETARLFVQQTGQANRLEIVSPTESQIFGKTFSPDGSLIYFLAQNKGEERPSLYRVSTLGGSPTRVLTDISFPVSFSPNGKEMLFGRWNKKSGESALVIAGSDGSEEKILLARTREQEVLTNPAWSPDGGSIAFCAVQQGSATITAINLITSETIALSPEKWDTCYRMAWTKDGQGLFFIGTKYAEGLTTRRDQIYYLSTKTGEARRLTFDGSRHGIFSLGVTDDNAVITIPFNRSSQIWQMSPDGDARTAIQITNGQADGRAGLAPLADGSVGYITRTGESLSAWLLGSNRTDQKQLINGLPIVEELRAAPDASFFVFVAVRERLRHLFRVDADGSNLRQMTFGDSQAGDSTISPDGKWIIYHSSVWADNRWKSSLWKLASAGGEPVRIGDAECLAPHFSPDGKLLSCVRDEKEILIISATDGAIVKSFAAVRNPTLSAGARWTADGRNLVYIVHQKNLVGNLWLQPVSGVAARPLTDFMSGSIYNFAFSPDGSRLYVARGNQINDAVLIENFK